MVRQVLETDRLIVREAAAGDAAFMLQLMNEPGWHRFIGDRGVRTVDAAGRYIESAMRVSYEWHGHGLCRVELKGSGESIGICGLVRRDTLPGPDLGFAFLERHHGKGFALESARATMHHARRVLGLARVFAVTSPDNIASIRLLEKLGFVLEKRVLLAEARPESLLFVNESTEGHLP